MEKRRRRVSFEPDSDCSENKTWEDLNDAYGVNLKDKNQKENSLSFNKMMTEDSQDIDDPPIIIDSEDFDERKNSFGEDDLFEVESCQFDEKIDQIEKDSPLTKKIFEEEKERATECKNRKDTVDDEYKINNITERVSGSKIIAKSMDKEECHLQTSPSLCEGKNSLNTSAASSSSSITIYVNIEENTFKIPISPL